LNLEELKQGLSEVKNGEEILALMQAADTDKSGTINYTGKFIFHNIFHRIYCCYS